MIFARKTPEFYTIIARKIFFPILGCTCLPCPHLLRLWALTPTDLSGIHRGGCWWLVRGTCGPSGNSLRWRATTPCRWGSIRSRTWGCAWGTATRGSEWTTIRWDWWTGRRYRADHWRGNPGDRTSGWIRPTAERTTAICRTTESRSSLHEAHIANFTDVIHTLFRLGSGDIHSRLGRIRGTVRRASRFTTN